MQQSSCPGNEVCLSTIQCSAQLTPEEAESKVCALQGGVSGACCKEISTLGTNQVPLGATKVGIRSIGQVNDVELRSALDFGESSFQNASLRSTQLNTIKNYQSSSGQHAFFTQASPGVAQLGKKCLVAMETARQLAITNKRKLSCVLSIVSKSYFTGSFFPYSQFLLSTAHVIWSLTLRPVIFSVVLLGQLF